MYSFVGFSKVVTGLTLGQAFRCLREMGRGAIYRGEPQLRSWPIYPALPRH